MRGSYIALGDAQNDVKLTKMSIIKNILNVWKILKGGAKNAEEFLSINSAQMGLATVGFNQGKIIPGSRLGDALLHSVADAYLSGLPSDGGNPIGGKAFVYVGPKGSVLPSTTSKFIPIDEIAPKNSNKNISVVLRRFEFWY